MVVQSDDKNWAHHIQKFRDVMCLKRNDIYAGYDDQYRSIKNTGVDTVLLNEVGLERYLRDCRTVYLFGRRCLGKTTWALAKSKHCDCFFVTKSKVSVREAFRLSRNERGHYHNRHDPNAANYIWIGTYDDLLGVTQGEAIPEKKFDLIVFDDTGITPEVKNFYPHILPLAKADSIIVQVE